jgi:hypothetical protein
MDESALAAQSEPGLEGRHNQEYPHRQCYEGALLTTGL